VPLPSYALEPNPQEWVGRWLRIVVTHNHTYASYDELVEATEPLITRMAAQPAV